jgi:hypothetical protein
VTPYLRTRKKQQLFQPDDPITRLSGPMGTFWSIFSN